MQALGVVSWLGTLARSPKTDKQLPGQRPMLAAQERGV
jgi:hypothetical protein